MADKSILEDVFASVRAAIEKRGSDPVVLDVSNLTSYADYFIFVSGSSDRRVKSIAEAIRSEMKERGVRLVGSEGLREGKWALLDFGSFIVHVFYEESRKIFDLEGLWSDAQRVTVPAGYLKPRPLAGKEEE